MHLILNSFYLFLTSDPQRLRPCTSGKKPVHPPASPTSGCKVNSYLPVHPLRCERIKCKNILIRRIAKYIRNSTLRAAIHCDFLGRFKVAKWSAMNMAH
uniref:Uncharacterized protein n=1 Tax=Pararge aegeria TaxID=116150 RepID=S4PK37_9NEOP